MSSKKYNDTIYADMEETVLACLLLQPELMEQLKVEEKHFLHFGYVFTFFKQVYEKYHTLDTTLMFSIIKGSSENQLMEVLAYLTEVFVLPNNFNKYQTRLLEQYRAEKADEWLRKKIYEKATKLFVGSMSVREFSKEVITLIKKAKEIDWK